jgi:outer membrane protein
MRILSLIVFFTWSLTAQVPLSLNTAIQLALTNNFQVKIASKNLEIAKNNNSRALTGQNPTVNLGVQTNNGYTNINNPASFLTELSSVSTGLIPALEMNWLLYNGNGFAINKNRLAELENLNENGARIVFENTVFNVIRAYFNLKVQSEQLNILSNALELSSERLNWIEARETFGQTGKFDRLQALDAFYADSSAYLMQLSNYRNSIRNFNTIIGESDLNQEYELTDNLVSGEDVWEFSMLEQMMWQNNSELRLQQINKSLAVVQTKLQQTALYPQINLRGGLNYNYNLASGRGTLLSGETLSLNALSSKTLNGTIGLAATFQVYDGGIRKKNIEAARIQEEIADYNMMEVKRNLLLALSNLLNDLSMQQDWRSLAEKSLENAKQNLEIAEERWRNGQINSFDFRTVQLSYYNTNQQLLNVLFNIRITETEIIRITGGLVK